LIQVNHKFVDFEIEIENIEGCVTIYRAIPRIEDIDPGIRLIIVVQDLDNYPQPEDDIDEDNLDALYYQMLESLFECSRREQERLNEQ
jgi:hypothetical protein